MSWALGFSHQIDVPAGLQGRDGYSFAFGRWSHDGSATPVSAQRWLVEADQDMQGRSLNAPKVGVLTANFVRLLDIQPYLDGGEFGELATTPEFAPWPGTQSLYPQLTKFSLASRPNAGYLSFWHWEAADSITGGWGGTPQASLRVGANLPRQQVGGGFFAGPGVAIQTTGPGVDGSLSATVTFPDGSLNSVSLPWAFKYPAGTYKIAVPAIFQRSESVRFALQGIDGLDSLANGTVSTPTPDQATKVVTVRLEKQLQPVVEVNPTCAGAIHLSNAAQWLPEGTVFSATASPLGGARFTHWSGTASGTNPTINVTASTVPELIANFNSIPEPFTLSNVTPAQYVLGHGPRMFELTGTGFTPETYVVIRNLTTHVPQYVDSRTLHVTLTDDDFPSRSDISVNLGTHVAGSCYGFTSRLSVRAVSISSYSLDYVQKAYFAYYGRPADPAGLDYWAARMDADGRSLNAIIAAFGNSDEFNRRYGGLTYAALVTKIYQQALKRAPDPAGLAYYDGELQSGRRTLQSITLDVLNGATTAPDSTVVANKLAVAAYDTAKVAAGCPYGTEQDGVNALSGVSAVFATVTAAKASIDSRCGA